MTRRRAPTRRPMPNNRKSGAPVVTSQEGAAPASTRTLLVHSSTRLMVSHRSSTDETAPVCMVSADFRIPLPGWRQLLSGLLLLVAFTTWGFVPPAPAPVPPRGGDHQVDLPLS